MVILLSRRAAVLGRVFGGSGWHMRGVLRVVCGLLLLVSPAWAEEVWPVPDWQVQPVVADQPLAALQAYAFAPRDETTRQGVRSNALLVVRDGRVVFERYAAGGGADIPQLSWSVSKSLMASVLGVAWSEGRFRLDDPVQQHYPPFAAHPQVKMGHLLNWASGLDWQEDYEFAPLRSSVVAMLYTRGRNDMAGFVAARDAAAAPGTRFNYSSGDSNVLSAALQQMLGSAYADYPWRALFEPLGIRSAVWERDGQGRFVASSYAYLSARDLARVGLLMQRQGRWVDRQLIDPAWVDFVLSPFAGYQASQQAPGAPLPGAHWWLNRPPAGQSARPWADAPADTFAALGHWGQALYVVPSEGLVVVRFADDRDGRFSHNQLLALVRAAFTTAQERP